MPGSNTGTLAKNFSAALIQHINNVLSLSLAEATEITKALDGTPYDDEAMKKIVAAIDAKVLRTPCRSKACKDGHYLQNWWKYCTADEWQHLQDPKKSWQSKMTKIVERANLLGCTEPGEQSIKWMMATLLMCHYHDLPGPKEIYDKLQDLKQVVAVERKIFPVDIQAPQVYPDSPADLPDDIKEYAYKADDQPISSEMPGINTIAKKIPLRANSKLLQPKGKDHKPSRPGPTKGAPTSCLQPSANTDATDDADENEEGGCFLHGSDLPTKGDIVEERLYMQYKADLWKHRATKKGLLQPDPPCHEHQAATAPKMQPGMHQHMGGAIPFKWEEDGSLTLGTRVYVHEHASGSGEGSGVKQEAFGSGEPNAGGLEAQCENGEKPQADGAKAEEAKAMAELDAYAQAAIDAFGKRNAKKKSEQKEKRKAAAMKKPAAMKRPSGSVKTDPVKAAENKEKKEAVKKEAVKKAVKHEPHIVTKAEIQKHMPKEGSDVNVKPPAVHYGGGVIYTDLKNKKFRCLRDRKDTYTEAAKAWGKKRSMKEAWKLAYESIEEFDKEAKKAKKSK